MPAGKRRQSNAMLYTLIIFVGLFILTTTIAVIYYLKFEEQRTIATTSQSKLNEMATGAELQRVGTLIGTIPRNKSGLGTMLNYLDETAYLIIGGLPEDTSAEVKVNTAKRQTEETLKMLAQKYPNTATDDPNTAGLIRVIEKLKINLDNATNTELALKKQLEDLQEFRLLHFLGMSKQTHPPPFCSDLAGLLYGENQ